MIQAFSLIYKFFNIASPCGDMTLQPDRVVTSRNEVSRYRLCLLALPPYDNIYL